MNYPSISSLPDSCLKNGTGIIRAATDVLDKKGDIQSDKRISVLKPTIEKLFDKGVNDLVICAYYGRPSRSYPGKEEKYSGILYESTMSGKPIAIRLSKITGRKVHFISALSEAGTFYIDYNEYFEHVKKYKLQNVKKGEIVFLDNLRFWDQENDKNSKGFEDFPAKISDLGDFYIQECYPQSHRENSTVVLTADHFNGCCAFGESYLKELRYFTKLREKLNKTNRGPVLFVFGGAKVKTGRNIVSKITVAKKLIKQLRSGDRIIIGGALAYTFRIARFMLDNNIIEAKNVSDDNFISLIGNSLIQKELIGDALYILKEGKAKGVIIEKLVDHRTTDLLDSFGKIMFSGKKFPAKANITVVKGNIPKGQAGVDIGPETEKIYINALKQCETVFISGPLGVFEDERAASGSLEFIKAMGEITEKGIETIAAGGETEALVSLTEAKLTHVSTGGGAALEDIQKDGKLPGTLAVLRNALKSIVS